MALRNVGKELETAKKSAAEQKQKEQRAAEALQEQQSICAHLKEQYELMSNLHSLENSKLEDAKKVLADTSRFLKENEEELQQLQRNIQEELASADWPVREHRSASQRREALSRELAALRAGTSPEHRMVERCKLMVSQSTACCARLVETVEAARIKSDDALQVFNRTRARALKAAEREHDFEARALRTLQAKADSLAQEFEQGSAAAVRPQLRRRAALPEGAAGSADAAGKLGASRRMLQLSAAAKMDWCVVDANERKVWEVMDFLKSPELRALRSLPKAEQKGKLLLQLPSVASSSTGDSSPRYLYIDGSLSAEIDCPKLNHPPARLNFFDLLRASLGDPQFEDVHLVPEGPHFHERALGLDRSRDIAPPEGLPLRPYQVAGFRWLASLARNGLGAILADDMGLGKTIQAIALLLYLKEQGLLTDERGRRRPALVVVPPGLLKNWQREFGQWAPELSIYTYHGMGRALPANQGAGVDVFLTTYHIVRNDVAIFCNAASIAFSCMILDEAQCIKNHSIKMTKAVKEVGSIIGHTRIALSGTPIENKVDELHSIFDFVNFGYLGTQAAFTRDFSRIIEAKKESPQRAEKLELLRRLTRPFQMRRLKTDPDILPDLPEKIEMVETVSLTREQQRLYQAAQDEWKSKMLASKRDSSNHNFERRGHIFHMFEKVRRICSHPLCLGREKFPAECSGMEISEKAEASGKAARLMELLGEILDMGHKVVVFVTRKAILHTLRQLVLRGFPQVEALLFSGDLSLNERNEVERKFAELPQCKVLLITVQCGGIGLNLTAASHVVHFDRCYNPAKEAQATDRCHRMGQRRAVCVHRLVTEGTYEERLEEIMKRKQDLSSLTVTSAEDWIADYDDAALFDLFTLRGQQTGSRAGGSKAPAVEPTPDPTEQETGGSASSSSSPPVAQTPSTPSRRAWAASALQGSPKAKKRPAPASTEYEEEECSICMDAPSTVTLRPCSHRVLCGECSLRVQLCPLCRAKIVERVGSR